MVAFVIYPRRNKRSSLWIIYSADQARAMDCLGGYSAGRARARNCLWDLYLAEEAKTSERLRELYSAERERASNCVCEVYAAEQAIVFVI